MTNLRLGVIGLSDHALENQTRAFVEAGAQVIAFADPQPTRLERAQRALAQLRRPAATEFGDAEQLFASGIVDAVVIITPTSTHYPLTMGALGAGLHVLVEKPMATNLREAAEMVARAKELRRVLHVGYQKRHVIAGAIEHVRGGLLGTVESVRATWKRPKEGDGRILLPASFWDDADRGGATLDLCHMLDLGLQFVQGAPEVVLASAWSERGREIHGVGFVAEDSFMGQVQCAGNAAAVYDLAWYADVKTEVSSVEITGSAGRLFVPVPTWEKDVSGLSARLTRGRRVEHLDAPLTNYGGHVVAANSFVADCTASTYVSPGAGELGTQALLDGSRTSFVERRPVALQAA